MSARKMTCSELVELVTDYLEGVVADEELARLHRHLHGCPGCRAYVEQVRETIRLLGSLASRRLPRRAAKKVVEALRRRSEDGLCGKTGPEGRPGPNGDEA